MTRDYAKKPARRNKGATRKANSPKKGRRLLRRMLVGVVLVVLLAFGFHFGAQQIIKVHAKQSGDIPLPVQPPKQTHAASPPKFDFYRILPESEQN